MKANTEQLVNELILAAGGRRSVTIAPCHRLVEDMGIDGDKAERFISLFSQRFGLDMTAYESSDYFTDEATRIVSWGLFIFPSLLLASFLSYFFVDFLIDFPDLSMAWLVYFTLNLPSAIFGFTIGFTGQDPSSLSNWFTILLLNLPSSAAAVFFLKKYLIPNPIFVHAPNKRLFVGDLYKIAQQGKW